MQSLLQLVTIACLYYVKIHDVFAGCSLTSDHTTTIIVIKSEELSHIVTTGVAAPCKMYVENAALTVRHPASTQQVRHQMSDGKTIQSLAAMSRRAAAL